MQPAEQPATTVAAGSDAATLERLSRLETHGRLILSVYIDLDPARFPTPPALGAQLGSLLDEARREGGEHDADRVEAWLGADPAVRQGARGLAVFCSVKAGIFEPVRLPSPVEPLAVLDTVPWLEPLAAMISPGDWAVAVVSRRAARLLRGGPQGLSEFACVRDEVHGRHAQGGWSQARFQRGIEEQVAAHVRGVADRLARAHRRRPFADLVIVAADELRPVIEHSLHPELAQLLAGAVDADLEHASVQEIAEAVAPLIERAQRQREHELVDRLEQALGTGGPAAAGLDEVLSTLEQQRVDTLLVAERSSLKAGLCPTCGRLSADGGRSCPLDGATLAEVDAAEQAVEKAASQAAQVVVLRHETDWLREHSKIAALLRW
jgi:peptide chain release factor subunit 1